MTIKEVIDGFREDAEENAERNAYANELFQEAVRIGIELNMQYHTPEEIREIMGRLIGKKVDDTFRMFPPFYTDFGKNITIGKDVFINSGCHFQDQGGILIGDGALIGHNVVLATINHDLNPEENRKNHYAPVTIGAHVWIGSNATILPGVTLGDHACCCCRSCSNAGCFAPDGGRRRSCKSIEGNSGRNITRMYLYVQIEWTN